MITPIARRRQIARDLARFVPRNGDGRFVKRRPLGPLVCAECRPFWHGCPHADVASHAAGDPMPCPDAPDGLHRFRLPPAGLVLTANCRFCGVERTYRPFTDESQQWTGRSMALSTPGGGKKPRVSRARIVGKVGLQKGDAS